jgi:hypothetical protein
MNLVYLIAFQPLRGFQNWFIKSGSFAANIQPYKRSILSNAVNIRLWMTSQFAWLTSVVTEAALLTSHWQLS